MPSLKRWENGCASGWALRWNNRGWLLAAMWLEESVDGYLNFPAARQRVGYWAEVDVSVLEVQLICTRQVPLLLPGEKVNALLPTRYTSTIKTVHREILLSRFWEYTSPSPPGNRSMWRYTPSASTSMTVCPI